MLRTAERLSRRASKSTFVRALLLVSAILGVSACAPSDPGHRVYDTKCAGCHGPDGRGRTKFAEGRPFADLTDGRWKHGSSHEAIVHLITDGDRKSPMPAYRGRLTPEQIDDVASFVERLSPGARPASPPPGGP